MTDDIKTRLFGLLLVLVAIAFGWFFILAPLQAGQSRAVESGHSIKIFVLVPFAMVFGLAFLIMGAGMKYRNATSTNFTLLGWAVLITAAIASGIGFFWFKSQLN